VRQFFSPRVSDEIIRLRRSSDEHNMTGLCNRLCHPCTEGKATWETAKILFSTIPIFSDLRPIYSVSKFSEFIGVELDLAPKREFVSHDLFYKCAQLQELWSSESIYFNGPNRANQLSFRQ
jgi:hypothetical protein